MPVPLLLKYYQLELTKAFPKVDEPFVYNNGYENILFDAIISDFYVLKFFASFTNIFGIVGSL